MTASQVGRPTAQRNPFEFGRELDADELVDRERELKQVIRAIENRGKLFVIGPRRYGKTSLLKAATTRVAERGITALRYDAEKFESLDLLAQAILTGAARTLAGPLEKIGEVLKRAAGRLKPEVNYDVTKGVLSVTLGVSPGASGDLPILTDALDAVEALASGARKTAVVVLDEFQQVVEQKGVTAEKQIRATIQRHQHVSYVFAGSKTRLLADMTGDAGRAFYKLGARLFIGAIPAEDFKKFLRDGFRAAGFTVEAEALEAILALAEEVPYNVQRLAHECWEALRVEPGRPLTPQLVQEARDRTVMQENPAYTQLWNSLTLVQKRAVKAVILEGGRALTSRDVTHRYKLGASSMAQALRILDARGVVREEELVGALRYRLEDPFFGAWLRMAQTL